MLFSLNVLSHLNTNLNVFKNLFYYKVYYTKVNIILTFFKINKLFLFLIINSNLHTTNHTTLIFLKNLKLFLNIIRLICYNRKLSVIEIKIKKTVRFMKTIIELVVKRPVTILMVIVSILILGLISLSRLSIDFMPSMQVPYVSIHTRYNNAGPEEIEKSITKIVEGAV